MYIIDWMTYCCYVVLRKLKYSEWNAKYTAILNSSVVVSCLFIIIIDTALLFISPQTLQTIYNNGAIFYLSVASVSLALLLLRYYCIYKGAIIQKEEKMAEMEKTNFWIYLISLFVILVGAIIGCIIMGEFIKSKGIVFG